MFTVMARIFGQDFIEGRAKTFGEAVEIAKEVNNRGWASVKIIHPNGVITQVFGQKEDDPFEKMIRETESFSDKEREAAIKVGRLLDGFTAKEVENVLGFVYNNFSINCRFTFGG